MSEQPPSRVTQPAGLLRADFEQMLASDRGAEAVERLLGVIASDGLWERENALAAIAGIPGAHALLPGLVTALRDPDAPERRNAARSALAVMAGEGSKTAPQAIATLGALLAEEADADVRVLAATALGESENPSAAGVLGGALTDVEPNVGAAAADALGVLRSPLGVAPLIRALSTADVWVRVAAVVSLGEIGDSRALPALRQAANDEMLSEAAASALGSIGEPAALETLRPLVAAGHPARRAAHRASALILGAHPETAAPDWLRDSLDGEEADLQRRLASGDEPAAFLLAIRGTRSAAAALLEFLETPHAPAVEAALSLLPSDTAEAVLLDFARSPGDGQPRAAAVGALPASLSDRAIAEVADLLSDPEERVAGAAAQALSRSDDTRVLPHLIAALGKPESRLAAVRALAMTGADRCTPLAGLLDDDDIRVRRAAAEGLARCATPEVRSRLAGALRSERDPAARRALIEALGATGGADVVRDLEPFLRATDVATRYAAVRALGHSGAEEAMEFLVGMLSDPAQEIQAAALHALGELGDPRSIGPLAKHLFDDDRDIRRTAAFAMREIASPRAVEFLRTALDDSAWSVRLAAIRTLAAVGDLTSHPRIAQLAASDPDATVREAAREALLLLGDGPDGSA